MYEEPPTDKGPPKTLMLKLITVCDSAKNLKPILAPKVGVLRFSGFCPAEENKVRYEDGGSHHNVEKHSKFVIWDDSTKPARLLDFELSRRLLIVNTPMLFHQRA